MTKKHYCFLFIIFIFLAVGSFCFARELEVKIPGLSLSGETDIVQYRNVLFNFLVGLGGALAILSLTIGAIQLIASAGNPESQGDAKKRIIGSVLGLILLFSSYLIMKIINPVLLSPANPPSLPPTSGVFLVAGEKEKICPSSINDTSELLSNGFNKIIYKCGSLDPDKKPILWVRKFPKTDLGDWANGTVEEIKCGGSASISDADKSFMLDIQRPGLYLYNQTGASSTASRSMQILSSQAEMNDVYKKNTKSSMIVNEPENKIYYGVLFHENIKFEGKCSNLYYPAVNAKSSVADLTISPSSFDFFQLNSDYLTSGDGITFYSRPFGIAAGYYEVPAKDITYGLGPLWEKKPGDIKFNYTGVAGVSEEDRNKCKTFSDCPGSIKIKGNYLVDLIAVDYCQSFYINVSNLTVPWIMNLPGIPLTKIIIAPIK